MTRVIFADRSGPRLVRARPMQGSAEQALAAATTKLAAALRREGERRKVVADELAHGLFELSTAIAHKLLQSTLQEKPERLLELLEPLVRSLQSATTLRIEAHPLDASLLRQHLCANMASLDDPESLVELEENANLSRGSLVIDSDVGALDGRLETRFGLIASALAKTLEAKT